MKTLTSHISKVLLTTLVLTFPMIVLGADPALSNMEMNLFLQQVEDEMIETSHQQTLDRSTMDNALQEITPTATSNVSESAQTSISDGAVDLMIANVEEEMVRSSHQETTAENLMSEALTSLASSNVQTDSEKTDNFLFNTKVLLFLHQVEEEMVRNDHQTTLNSNLINAAMNKLSLQLSRSRTELTRTAEDTVPTDGQIEKFINEVETDMTYFNTTLVVYSTLPTLSF